MPLMLQADGMLPDAMVSEVISPPWLHRLISLLLRPSTLDHSLSTFLLYKELSAIKTSGKAAIKMVWIGLYYGLNPMLVLKCVHSKICILYKDGRNFRWI